MGTKHNSKLQSIRQRLGSESYEFISDDRIIMMLKMTNSNIRQALLMALGYIVPVIDMLMKDEDTTAATRKDLEVLRANYKNMIDTELSQIEH